MKKLSKELVSALSEGLPERRSKKGLKSGVDCADEIISLVRNQRYARVMGIGDDFIPDTGLYNMIGSIYSSLPREKRVEARDAVLSQLDGVNSHYVQMNHTPYIREPLLLSDIAVERPMYWCGLYEGKNLLEKQDTFAGFKKTLMNSNGLFKKDKVFSDFCVAYSALRKDMSSFGDAYANEAHPAFLDRVVDGIVSLRIGKPAKNSDLIAGRERLKELLPEGLQSLVDEKYLCKCAHLF